MKIRSDKYLTVSTKKIDPHAKGWGPFDFNLWDLPEEEKAKLGGLPKTLSEALDALEADHDYLTKGGVFPERLIQTLIKRARACDDVVMHTPHPKEFELYYDF